MQHVVPDEFKRIIEAQKVRVCAYPIPIDDVCHIAESETVPHARLQSAVASARHGVHSLRSGAIRLLFLESREYGMVVRYANR